MSLTSRALHGAEAEQADRKTGISRSDDAIFALQRSVGNRAIASALSVQRDGSTPTSLGMRDPPALGGPGSGLMGGLGGLGLPGFSYSQMQHFLADQDAQRPKITIDVYTRGTNPRLFQAMGGTLPTGGPAVTGGGQQAQQGGGGTGGGAQAPAGPREDDHRPHFEVHPQVQAGVAANAQFNQAAVGPGAQSTRAAAPGTQTSTQTQLVAGLVLQFHDDAHWGIEFTPFQGQVNLDQTGRITGWQGNMQLSIASAAIDTCLSGDDGEHWKAQLQGFVQGSAGQGFDAPDATGASQSHPTGSLQVGGQAALTHGPVQLWLQVTGGMNATTSSGANPQFVMTPGVSGAVGVTIQF